jgi:hypothetical protein
MNPIENPVREVAFVKTRLFRDPMYRADDIPERVWRGEGFGSAEEFRSCHIRCMKEHKLHDDFEFMVVHFKLIEEVKKLN